MSTKQCKIRICYENERGTPQPEYISLKGEKGLPAHPRLWTMSVTNGTDKINKWKKKLPSKLAAPELAAAILKLESILGITDPTSLEDWQSKGVDISYTPAGGFVNWPDPDLGKSW